MLNTAIDNLHKCLWFEIYEQMDQSLEMLKYQTGVDVKMIHANQNKHKPKYNGLTKSEIKKIKSLMPMDMYLYEYTKQLHGHRWKTFTNQGLGEERETYQFPKLPTTLFGCKSSKCTLFCPSYNVTYTDPTGRFHCADIKCLINRQFISPPRDHIHGYILPSHTTLPDHYKWQSINSSQHKNFIYLNGHSRTHN